MYKNYNFQEHVTMQTHKYYYASKYVYSLCPLPIYVGFNKLLCNINIGLSLPLLIKPSSCPKY